MTSQVARVSIEVDGRQPKDVARQLNAAFKKAEVGANKLKKAVQRTGASFERMRQKGVSALEKVGKKAKQAAANFKGMGKAAAIAAAAAAAVSLLGRRLFSALQPHEHRRRGIGALSALFARKDATQASWQ